SPPLPCWRRSRLDRLRGFAHARHRVARETDFRVRRRKRGAADRTKVLHRTDTRSCLRCSERDPDAILVIRCRKWKYTCRGRYPGTTALTQPTSSLAFVTPAQQARIPPIRLYQCRGTLC